MDEWEAKFWLANGLSVTPLWLLYYYGQECHFPHSLTAEWEGLVFERVETMKGKSVGWRGGLERRNCHPFWLLVEADSGYGNETV